MKRTDAGDDLLDDLFASLASTHEEAVTRRNGRRAGLADYAFHVGHTGTRYEIPIDHRLRECLSAQGWDACDVCYPSSRQECDRVVSRGGSSIWLETKLVWREWPSSISGRIAVSRNDGDVLGSTCSDSLAQDFAKLEIIGRELATHLAVVALAFDADHNRLDAVIERMEREQRLVQRGWSRTAPRVLVDWNSRAHRIVLWGWCKHVDVAS